MAKKTTNNEIKATVNAKASTTAKKSTKAKKGMDEIAKIMQNLVAMRNKKTYKATPEQRNAFIKAYNGAIDKKNPPLLSAETVFDAITELSRIKGLEVVVTGSWIWIYGETRENAEKIKAFKGAAFDKAKKTGWYFKNTNTKTRYKTRYKMSAEQRAEKYGAYKVESKRRVARAV